MSAAIGLFTPLDKALAEIEPTRPRSQVLAGFTVADFLARRSEVLYSFRPEDFETVLTDFYALDDAFMDAISVDPSSETAEIGRLLATPLREFVDPSHQALHRHSVTEQFRLVDVLRHRKGVLRNLYPIPYVGKGKLQDMLECIEDRIAAFVKEQALRSTAVSFAQGGRSQSSQAGIDTSLRRLSVTSVDSFSIPHAFPALFPFGLPDALSRLAAVSLTDFLFRRPQVVKRFKLSMRETIQNTLAAIDNECVAAVKTGRCDIACEIGHLLSTSIADIEGLTPSHRQALLGKMSVDSQITVGIFIGDPQFVDSLVAKGVSWSKAESIANRVLRFVATFVEAHSDQSLGAPEREVLSRYSKRSNSPESELPRKSESIGLSLHDRLPDILAKIVPPRSLLALLPLYTSSLRDFIANRHHLLTLIASREGRAIAQEAFDALDRLFANSAANNQRDLAGDLGRLLQTPLSMALNFEPDDPLPTPWQPDYDPPISAILRDPQSCKKQLESRSQSALATKTLSKLRRILSRIAEARSGDRSGLSQLQIVFLREAPPKATLNPDPVPLKLALAQKTLSERQIAILSSGPFDGITVGEALQNPGLIGEVLADFEFKPDKTDVVLRQTLSKFVRYWPYHARRLNEQGELLARRTFDPTRIRPCVRQLAVLSRLEPDHHVILESITANLGRDEAGLLLTLYGWPGKFPSWERLWNAGMTRNGCHLLTRIRRDLADRIAPELAAYIVANEESAWAAVSKGESDSPSARTYASVQSVDPLFRLCLGVFDCSPRKWLNEFASVQGGRMIRGATDQTFDAGIDSSGWP